MKSTKLIKTALACIMAVWIAMGSVAFAAQSATSETATTATKEKATDALQSIKQYSVNRRAEAVQKAKAAMEELDILIENMEAKIREKWGQMDQTARNKSKATLKELRKQRNEVAEWYGGVKHGSRKAWNDVKKGFVKSYQDLRNAFQKAQKEF